MAAAPDPTKSKVPGSGTAGGGGGGGGGLQLPVVHPGPPPGVGGFDPVGPPIGSGTNPLGGPNPPDVPPEEGPAGIPGSPSNKLELRLGNTSVPLATASGRSNSAIIGSSGDVFACGSTETWLAQRVRAVMWPSVSSFSPGCRLACLCVQ